MFERRCAHGTSNRAIYKRAVSLCASITLTVTRCGRSVRWNLKTAVVLTYHRCLRHFSSDNPLKWWVNLDCVSLLLCISRIKLQLCWWTWVHDDANVVLVVAWVHQRSCRPGRSPDGQRLLGAVLSGAWHPAWWSDAERQNHWRRRRLVQHVLQRDWSRQTRATCCLRWPWTHCSGWECTLQLFSVTELGMKSSKISTAL